MRKVDSGKENCGTTCSAAVRFAWRTPVEVRCSTWRTRACSESSVRSSAKGGRFALETAARAALRVVLACDSCDVGV